MSRPRLSLLLDASGRSTSAELGLTVSTVFRGPRDDQWELVVAGPDSIGDPGRLAPETSGAGVRQVAPPDSPHPADERAAALQEALAAAAGDHVAVVAPGDIVEPGALAAVADYLAGRPHVDVLFTDEQWPGQGAEGIFAKPDWNPEYLLGRDYLGRLCFVRRELLRSVGGFRAGTSGVEEWDAHLRVTEAGAVVEHIPAVALTRSVPPETGPLVQAAAVRVVEEHLARVGRPATAEPAELPGTVRVWRSIDTPPLVSVVIPTIGTRRSVRGNDLRLVTHCVSSILEHTTYDRWEIVLVRSEGTPAGVTQEVADVVGDRLVVTDVTSPFNFSVAVNEGVRVAHGELVLLLNDDVEVIEPRWLERMVGVLQEPTIGVVGAKLLFEDGTIQHLGVVHNDAWEPSHAFEFTPDGPAHFGMGVLDLDYAAVTGACLLTSRDVFRRVGGFTTELPLNFNDVDFCLKVRANGLRVVCTPFARLHHFESASRVPTLTDHERAYLRDHWRAAAYGDGFVNMREVR